MIHVMGGLILAGMLVATLGCALQEETEAVKDSTHTVIIAGFTVIALAIIVALAIIA
jgi:hypothetical protein